MLLLRRVKVNDVMGHEAGRTKGSLTRGLAVRSLYSRIHNAHFVGVV